MKKVLISTAVAVICFLNVSVIAFAQRGTGDMQGIARQPIKPKIVSLSGTLVEVKAGPCHATTGRANVGTHLILEDAKKKQYNIHLGPEQALADTVAKFSTEQPLSVKAFRTEKMKQHHYMAQSQTFNKKV